MMPGAIGPRSRSLPVAPTAWRPGESLTSPKVRQSRLQRPHGAAKSRARMIQISTPLELVPASCPSPDLIRGLSRASTSFLLLLRKQDVGGRDKPGHDSEQMDRYERNAP
jgi:hypothetical protein